MTLTDLCSNCNHRRISKNSLRQYDLFGYLLLTLLLSEILLPIRYVLVIMVKVEVRLVKVGKLGRLLFGKGPSTYYVILFTVKRFRGVTFFLVNRVERQKLNLTTAELPFG